MALQKALAEPGDALSRKIAADVVDIEISNLLSPDQGYRLDGVRSDVPVALERVGLGTGR